MCLRQLMSMQTEVFPFPNNSKYTQMVLKTPVKTHHIFVTVCYARQVLIQVCQANYILCCMEPCCNKETVQLAVLSHWNNSLFWIANCITSCLVNNVFYVWRSILFPLIIILEKHLSDSVDGLVVSNYLYTLRFVFGIDFRYERSLFIYNCFHRVYQFCRQVFFFF